MNYLCIMNQETRHSMLKRLAKPLLTLLFATICLASVKGVEKSVPFEFGASYIGEGMSLLAGGLQRGSSYEGLANIRFSFHTAKAGWWKGGSFLVTGANTHGGTPSSDLIGDHQVASNIEAGDLTYLHECWFRQELGAWTFILGLQDLNSEFVYSKSGNTFLNSSFGTHSTIAGNVPSPIFPLTSFGAQAHFRLNPKTTLKLAVFDGMPEDFDYNPHNISWHLDSDDGYLAFVELDAADLLHARLSGDSKLGVYFHNHNPNTVKFDPSAPNYGFYMTADQTLVQFSLERSLNAFLQFSLSPASKNENNRYLGGGIHCKGPFAGRPDDKLGLAFAHASLQHAANGDETSVELTYKLALCEQVFLQPDLQYIQHPAGTGGTPENALVAFIRFGIEF